VPDTKGPKSVKEQIRLAKQRQAEINDKFKTLEGKNRQINDE